MDVESQRGNETTIQVEEEHQAEGMLDGTTLEEIQWDNSSFDQQVLDYDMEEAKGINSGHAANNTIQGEALNEAADPEVLPDFQQFEKSEEQPLAAATPDATLGFSDGSCSMDLDSSQDEADMGPIGAGGNTQEENTQEPSFIRVEEDRCETCGGRLFWNSGDLSCAKPLCRYGR
ncbi:hypothetical protein ABW19_dt0205774 [Dactylella cylindrospora]|nr:hypothetical protein ABW19_dt0205774 [Dactylella cylindrospora]